jgi:RNA polymerase-binding transcription factor
MAPDPFRNDSDGVGSMFDMPPCVGYTYRLLMPCREPRAGRIAPLQRGSMPSKPKLLTEAEIVKMPKSDYMNAAQLRFFRERLLDLQKQLRENAGATTEHLRELSFAPDPADRATLEEEHALELRTRDRERKLLKKIDQALTRIEDGSYGYCEETGEPIGIQRLLARPTATLTIEAQERREMKQKLYGE